MAVLGQPVGKISRRLGIGITAKGAKALRRRPNPPGQHGGSGKPKKISDYGMQLLEKQKCRFLYGVREEQFRRIFAKALRLPGPTGENLLMLLEERLDNIVYRLGWAATRTQARQIVNHGHITVNGIPTDIPSYTARVGDTIAIAEKSRSNRYYKELLNDGIGPNRVPAWLKREASNHTASILSVPRREQAEQEVNEQIIVEFYSR